MVRVASILVPLVTAALIHTGVSSRPAPGASVVAALVVLVAALVILRALADRRLLVLAAGGVLAVTGLGTDAVSGYRGFVHLREGQVTRNLEEEPAGPSGPRLRPLGFEMGFLGRTEGGFRFATREGTGYSPFVLSPHRGETLRGVRLGAPRRSPTGEAAALSVRVSRRGGSDLLEVRPGEAARLDDLEVGLETYFPDFELSNGEPGTRSAEPRNPAAVLSVAKGDDTYRVLVLRDLPGLHQVGDLDASFALLGVEEVEAVRLPVAREPGSFLVGLGAALMAVGCLVSSRAA